MREGKRFNLERGYPIPLHSGIKQTREEEDNGMKCSTVKYRVVEGSTGTKWLDRVVIDSVRSHLVHSPCHVRSAWGRVIYAL